MGGFISGLITGGVLYKIIDYGIAWVKERREQKSAKTSHEKDRPRFRVDITKTEGPHPGIPAFVVKILSLGSLPLTINNGEVFIKAEHYPEHVQTEKLNGRVISPHSPIEFKFPLPLKITDPLSGGKPAVQMVCQFSYGKDAGRYEERWVYDHRTANFNPEN
jgi:hypothetical protein